MVVEVSGISTRRWFGLVTVLLLLPVPAIYFYGAVEAVPYHHLLDCRFRQWLGIPCAGCGMTHAFFLFFHGHWAAAFHANPLFPLLLLGWGMLSVHCGLLALEYKSPLRSWLLYGIVPLLAVGTIILWLARVCFGVFPVS